MAPQRLAIQKPRKCPSATCTHCRSVPPSTAPTRGSATAEVLR